jgi:hypothetical protein
MKLGTKYFYCGLSLFSDTEKFSKFLKVVRKACEVHLDRLKKVLTIFNQKLDPIQMHKNKMKFFWATSGTENEARFEH